MEKGKEYFLMFLPECSRLSNNMNFDMIWRIIYSNELPDFIIFIST
jgi:hypothetical protein